MLRIDRLTRSHAKPQTLIEQIVAIVHFTRIELKFKLKYNLKFKMTKPNISYGNIFNMPTFGKQQLLDVYAKSNINLQKNVKLLQKIPNIIELCEKYFLSQLNANKSDKVRLYCISDEHDIYAFCFVQFKGVNNNQPYYKLSSLTVNPNHQSENYDKMLIDKIISEISIESGYIYCFLPKIFKNNTFDLLSEYGELTTSVDKFPEDPTSWLDDNGKLYFPLDSWNCFWYPKQLTF